MRSCAQDAEPPLPHSADAVVERMRDVMGVANDAQLGRALGLRESAPGNWRARNSVPYRQCVEIAADRGVSLDWLLLGRGARGYGIGEAPAPEYLRPAPLPEPRAASPPTGDRRLDAILAWWRAWWAAADDDERTWALVQLRRAIPECAEPIRRAVERDHT